MQEIELKDNLSNLKIYIDDLPLKELIPKEEIDIFINALEIEIFEIIKKKEQRRNYYLKSKRDKGTTIPP